eukprot:gene1645-11827_t
METVSPGAGPGWYRDNPASAATKITSRRQWWYPNGTSVAALCPLSCEVCARETPDEVYFVRAERFDDGYGLDWWIVTGIDRKFIFDEIDKQTLRTQATIKQVNEDVDKERESDLNELIGAVVGLGIGLMLFSIVFAYFIVRPINKLAAQMKCVAQMDLDKVELHEKPSMLVEVMRMQKDFRKMVYCIKKY